VTLPVTEARRPGGYRIGNRLAIGCGLAVVALSAVLSVPAFAALVLVLVLASLYELSRLSARKDVEIVFPVASVACACYIVLAAMRLLHRFEAELLATTVVAALGFSLAGKQQGYFARSAYTLLGVCYLGKLGSYFITLRTLPHGGLAYTYLAIVLIGLTDIFAMVVGVRLGRTPLTPISPRKTVEGALGGLAVTTLAGIAAALFVPALDLPWWQGAIVAVVTSVAAQGGDLVESALKRDALVKEAGTLLGGHGGVLDRFDSYAFGGVAFYFALFITGHIPPIGP